MLIEECSIAHYPLFLLCWSVWLDDNVCVGVCIFYGI